MKKLVAKLGLVSSLLWVSACSPEEVSYWKMVHDTVDPRAESKGLTDEGLYQLRLCESTDNYQAVDRWGKYRGAYQFDQPTWDGVARRHIPFLVGRDPAGVNSFWQDVMAKALWSERGWQPWPVCGRSVR